MHSFKISVQLKSASMFFLLIALLLVFLNTYPLTMSRDLVFTSKCSSLEGQAAVISTALSALDELTEDGVNQVMELMNTKSLTRVLVTNESGLILFDTSQSDASVGFYALFPEIAKALSGNQFFSSDFTGSAFLSKTAVPIVAHQTVRGAVYLYEYDEEQADLINALKGNLSSISLVVGVFAIIMTLFFTRTLSARINKLVDAMHIVREGEYDYRTEIRGNDEIAELGEEFNNLTDRLQETEEMRRRFVSDASHELRTPLASIRLLTDSILQSENMDSETMRDFVGDIGSEAERLQRMTEKLLALTKLDNRAAEEEPVNVGAVVQRTLHLLTPLAEKRLVSLRCELADDCVILAQEDDLYQIIFNLAENGIKYNVSGGEVQILLFRADNEVKLVIKDTGIGIPEKDLDNIFDRFYRVDKARSREAGGTGLGLSIVHDAVTAHGGTISVKSRRNGGTRFEVRFPEFSEKDGTEE